MKWFGNVRNIKQVILRFWFGPWNGCIIVNSSCWKSGWALSMEGCGSEMWTSPVVDILVSGWSLLLLSNSQLNPVSAGNITKWLGMNCKISHACSIDQGVLSYTYNGRSYTWCKSPAIYGKTRGGLSIWIFHHILHMLVQYSTMYWLVLMQICT